MLNNKAEKWWKIVGCFWTWQKVSFGFGFSEVLILKRFVFSVTGIVSKVSKMLCFFFPGFGAFLGWLLLVYLGLEGLGAFVFLVFCFSLLVLVLFLFVCFVIGFVVVLILFCFFFCFFCFFCFCFCCFIGGFKGQVRWPKGPPHLALYPSYLLVLVFCLLLLFFCLFYFGLCFFLFLFLEGWRVRLGGPKGHLTWP